MSDHPKNPCPSCGNHMRMVQHLSLNSFQFECTICCCTYTYEAFCIQENQLAVNKNMRYCALCDKTFSQACGLKRHILEAHRNVRPYTCAVCEKAFKARAALKRHMVIHTGECPYECSTCKRKFNQINNLRKHLVIHNNSCPYYCTICEKGFNQMSNLKKHMLVHSREEIVKSKSKKHATPIPIGLKKTENRPLLTFVKPANE